MKFPTSFFRAAARHVCAIAWHASRSKNLPSVIGAVAVFAVTRIIKTSDFTTSDAIWAGGVFVGTSALFGLLDYVVSSKMRRSPPPAGLTP